jgi:hypothetical protein
MPASPRRRPLRAWVAAMGGGAIAFGAGFVVACNALLGNVEGEPQVLPGGPDGSIADGTASTDGSQEGDAKRPSDARVVDAASPDGAACIEDSRNCGACGHDCLGGACVASTCQPFVIASARLGPSAVAVAGAYAYVAEQGTATQATRDGRLSRALLAGGCDGGCMNVLATDLVSPAGVTVTTTDAYVAASGVSSNTGTIVRVPLDGTLPQVAASGEASPRRIAVANGSLYWIAAGATGTASSGAVRRMFLDGDAGVTIVPRVSFPFGLDVKGDTLVYTTTGDGDFTGEIVMTDATGQGRRVLADAQASPRGVAILPTHVVWANRGNGTLSRVRHDGSDPKEIVTNSRLPSDVVFDGTHLYWAEQGTEPDLTDGALVRAAADGSDVKRLIENLPRPSAVAFDGRVVVVACRGTLAAGYRDGVVYAIAK